jgi:hypothetical protein
MRGIDGAHEKGGVEHEGGRIRRTHLVPVPDVQTLSDLNERLAGIDAAEDARQVHGNAASIGERFATERELLRPLPDEEFDCGITLTPTVRRDSRIVVDLHRPRGTPRHGRGVRRPVLQMEAHIRDGRLCAAIVDPAHLQRSHHRDRHRLLPARPDIIPSQRRPLTRRHDARHQCRAEKRGSVILTR